MRRVNDILIAMVALMVLTLTSCMNNEEIERNPETAVSFRVVSNKATKGTELTTSSLTNFDVRAYRTANGTTNDDLFFTGSLEGSNAAGWKYQGHTMFWPESNVNIFSFAPQGTINSVVDATGVEVPNFVVDGGTDVVYAMNANESGAKHIADPVQLNFRHAMSQIVFRVSNTNWRLYIEIYGIRIVGINNTGSFRVENKTTDAESKGECVWINQSASKPIKEVSYTAMETRNSENVAVMQEKAGQTLFEGNFEGGVLGGNTPAGQPAETSPLFLMPQMLPTWNVSANPDGTYKSDGSARIEILCVIRQKCLPLWDWDPWPWMKIWPRESTPADKLVNGAAWVAIPLTNPTEVVNGETVEVGWKPGRRYVYSLIFGDGAGFNPDLDTPSLIPVTYKVAIGNFSDGGTYDVPEKQ